MPWYQIDSSQIVSDSCLFGKDENFPVCLQVVNKMINKNTWQRKSLATKQCAEYLVGPVYLAEFKILKL